MTDQTEALVKLLAKVEAGEPYETMGHTRMCQKAFPNPEDFDGSREAYAKSAAQQAILVWRNGSLDAANALHEGVLPEWDHGHDGSIAWVKQKDKRTSYRHDAQNGFTARAWLIAIIKALIAEETT